MLAGTVKLIVKDRRHSVQLGILVRELLQILVDALGLLPATMLVGDRVAHLILLSVRNTEGSSKVADRRARDEELMSAHISHVVTATLAAQLLLSKLPLLDREVQVNVGHA